MSKPLFIADFFTMAVLLSLFTDVSVNPLIGCLYSYIYCKWVDSHYGEMTIRRLIL